jgi:uncharacterized glyoxalase superfamily protein PhnB
MSDFVKPIPEGYHTVTPHLILNDTGAALDFYKKAFGAEEICRMPGPGGKGVMHAEIRIGNSALMLADEWPGMGTKSPKSLGGASSTIHLYVENVDKAFEQAVAAGATPEMPPSDMFWGDRYGKLTDPFGVSWSVATHIKDMTPEEIGKAADAFFSQAEPCDK